MRRGSETRTSTATDEGADGGEWTFKTHKRVSSFFFFELEKQKGAEERTVEEQREWEKAERAVTAVTEAMKMDTVAGAAGDTGGVGVGSEDVGGVTADGTSTNLIPRAATAATAATTTSSGQNCGEQQVDPVTPCDM